MGVRRERLGGPGERPRTEPDPSLDALHDRLAAIDADDRTGGECWEAHAAILDRLEANRRAAEAAGWTSLALEREGDRGRFRLVGIPPGGTLRTEVFDAQRDAPAPRDPRGDHRA